MVPRDAACGGALEPGVSCKKESSLPINKVKIEEDLESSDLNQVLFSDPLSENTRKVRRNLIIASFACVLISVFTLTITGFLGLKAESGAIENEIAKGLGAIICIYYLSIFVIYSIIDIFAWKFKKEKILITPFQELVENIEGDYHTLKLHIQSHANKINNFSPDSDMRSEIHNDQQIQKINELFNGTKKGIDHLHESVAPFLKEWRVRCKKLKIANTRLVFRKASLYILDILIPLLLASLALYKTLESIPSALGAIFYS